MELKRYQRHVLRDLQDYISLLNKGGQSLSAIYAEYWRQKGVEISENPSYLHPYDNSVRGVPRVTLKVPTAGGKTFIACNALQTVFSNLRAGMNDNKVVAWFVPSDTILTQTLRNLQDPNHPYRQKLDALFAHHVTVVSKEEALRGQDISPLNLKENLTVFVLSAQSFIENKKDPLKSCAYRQNGSLQEHADAYTHPEAKIEGADPTSLIQVIAQQCPLLIVDEGHHFNSTLRVELMKNLSPRLIVELTATPRETNNVISFVDAMSLKKANMVKLPVVVVNRRKADDVVATAIRMRRSLERHATEAERKGGRYIRPIALLQAQPKTETDSVTFDKIKNTLIKAGIPEEHVKIKTAKINELKGIDLMSRDCQVRYIITVNALQEGWDCPFAYILASIANRTSPVDVEQILGRVLRQPYTENQPDRLLNLAYVFTSSADFGQTVDGIVRSLLNLGYSRKDFRSAEDTLDDEISTSQSGSAAPHTSVGAGGQTSFIPDQPVQTDEEQDPLGDDSAENIKQQIEEGSDDEVESIEDAADKMGEEYEEQANETSDETNTVDAMRKQHTYPMQEEYREEGKQIILHQFVVKVHPNNFFSDEWELLNKERLTEGIDLSQKDSDVDFTVTEQHETLIDLQKSGEDYVPKICHNPKALDDVRMQFTTMPIKQRREQLAGKIVQRIRLDCVPELQIKEYVQRAIQGLDERQLLFYFDNTEDAKDRIVSKLDGIMLEYRKRKFEDWLNVGKIELRPKYKMLDKVTLQKPELESVGKGLYVAEESGNAFENRVIRAIAECENVQFWHRNSQHSPDGFCINGFINHYPDFIVYTRNNHTVLVETKGGHLKASEDTKNKIWLGSRWASLADGKCRYYMVVENEPPEGAITTTQLIQYLSELK
ncbi:MAG: DEAD/DEAH box helicase family protein [Prevotellaceae bacterium]|nr:DEAD/DEAH box helicase family protein [Prevotellaceae bacterium]